jgi:1-acyl-sn-glycerol-3-phosphate acyltransferase
MTLGCPRRGTPRSRAFARRLLALGGWRVEGKLPDLPRFVVIAAPHTSNWDFPIGMLAMLSIGLRLSWIGKHTLFRFPVAGLLRWLGGEPIDRAATHGTVPAAIARFQTRSQWAFGVSPEGTRRRVQEWKTGFHRIARGAGVPILPVTFDYSRRVVALGPPFTPTEDMEGDIRYLRSLYHPRMARHPEHFLPPKTGGDTFR